MSVDVVLSHDLLAHPPFSLLLSSLCNSGGGGGAGLSDGGGGELKVNFYNGYGGTGNKDDYNLVRLVRSGE